MKSYDNCPILYIDNDVDLAVAQFPEAKKVYDRGFWLNMEIQEDGQEVWSAGFPGLLGQAGWQFSRGDITNSRARVPQLIDPKISHVIQHSASIDPGNSGGPLLLKNPRSPLGYDVVGVNTWSIRNRQNTFFSISSKAVRMILDKAKAARDTKADQEKLKPRLVKNCKILAAELGSESRDYGRLRAARGVVAGAGGSTSLRIGKGYLAVDATPSSAADGLSRSEGWTMGGGHCWMKARTAH